MQTVMGDMLQNRICKICGRTDRGVHRQGFISALEITRTKVLNQRLTRSKGWGMAWIKSNSV